MGSIAEKLTYLNETKVALREAINHAGGNITTTTPFRQYVNWVREQGATLSLDFENQQYITRNTETMFPDSLGENIITFTRASGGGRFNAQGVYEWLPADQPRIDFDPVTGEAKGLLIEEQRTNLVRRSNAIGGVGWITSSTLVTTNAVLAPDGSLTGSSFSHNAGGSGYLYQAITYAGGSGDITLSVYAKSSSGAGTFYMRLFEQGGVAPSVFTNSPVFTLTGQWQRFSFTKKLTESDRTSLQMVLVSGVGMVVDVWGAQLEVGPFPTSYIPTTDAQVTRAADVASVNVLSPWYRADEGTLVVEASTFGNRPAWAYAQLWNSTTTTGDRIALTRVQGTGVSANITTGGVVQVSSSGADPAAVKAALAFRENDVAVSVNGAPVVVDSSAVLPVSVNRMVIGRSAATDTYLNGHIRSIRYYPRRLSDESLVELTTP